MAGKSDGGGDGGGDGDDGGHSEASTFSSNSFLGEPPPGPNTAEYKLGMAQPHGDDVPDDQALRNARRAEMTAPIPTWYDQCSDGENPAESYQAQSREAGLRGQSRLSGAKTAQPHGANISNDQALRSASNTTMTAPRKAKRPARGNQLNQPGNDNSVGNSATPSYPAWYNSDLEGKNSKPIYEMIDKFDDFRKAGPRGQSNPCADSMVPQAEPKKVSHASSSDQGVGVQSGSGIIKEALPEKTMFEAGGGRERRQFSRIPEPSIKAKQNLATAPQSGRRYARFGGASGLNPFGDRLEDYEAEDTEDEIVSTRTGAASSITAKAPRASPTTTMSKQSVGSVPWIGS